MKRELEKIYHKGLEVGYTWLLPNGLWLARYKHRYSDGSCVILPTASTYESSGDAEKDIIQHYESRSFAIYS